MSTGQLLHFSFHMLTIKNKMLTIGNSTNFWRNSWESYRLKSPKSAVVKKRNAKWINTARHAPHDTALWINPITCPFLHLVRGKIDIQELQNGVMPFGKLQWKTNFRRGGAHLLWKGIASASENVKVQNRYQIHSACWQHSQQCWVSQASALLKSYNCPSLQNILARGTK